MSDEPDNLVLRYLRRIDATGADTAAKVHDLGDRVMTLGRQMGQLMGNTQPQYAAIMAMLSRVDSRLDRLERRAELVTGIPGTARNFVGGQST